MRTANNDKAAAWVKQNGVKASHGTFAEKDWFGWQSVIGLGDITTARGTEMVLSLRVSLMGKMGTPRFNFKIVK